MIRFTIKYYLWLTILTLSFLFLSSCASFGPTKPNPVFQGPYPTKYYELADKNPLLAKELGKLPETQEGISSSDASALEKVVDIYNQIPKEFNDAFDKMYQVGKPEVRKYCTPLQALFWLVESDRVDDTKGILGDYSLEKLLRWTWPAGPGHLSYEQIFNIIDGVKSAEDRKGYKKALSNFSYSRFQEMVFSDYYGYSEMFSQKALNIIKEASEPRKAEDPRWKDFDTVVERLNAPKLIDYYINENFGYYLSSTSAKQTPGLTFKYREGSCSSLAKFGNFALKKAGFKTRYRRVNFVQDGHTGLVIMLNDGSYFIAVDFGPWGNRMGGPYTKISDIDNQLAKGKRITDSHWGLPTYAW